jgi:hypothetical protein
MIKLIDCRKLVKPKTIYSHVFSKKTKPNASISRRPSIESTAIFILQKDAPVQQESAIRRFKKAN